MSQRWLNFTESNAPLVKSLLDLYGIAEQNTAVEVSGSSLTSTYQKSYYSPQSYYNHATPFN